MSSIAWLLDSNASETDAEGLRRDHQLLSLALSAMRLGGSASAAEVASVEAALAWIQEDLHDDGNDQKTE